MEAGGICWGSEGGNFYEMAPSWLEIIGAASLLAVVFLGVRIVYGNSSDRVNKATRKDVQFAPNWGGISTNQDYRIVSSYQSSRSFTGDHLDYFCIELPKFEVAEWAKNQWHDGLRQTYC
jgi:hypothetical protein